MVKSLLEILRDVTLDPQQREVFDADPSQYLAQQGHEGVSDADIREAFSLVADTLPAEQAQALHATNLAGDSYQELGLTHGSEVYGHTEHDFDDSDLGADSDHMVAIDEDDLAYDDDSDADGGHLADALDDAGAGIGFGEGSGDLDSMYHPDAASDLDEVDQIGHDQEEPEGDDPFDLNPFEPDLHELDDLDQAVNQRVDDADEHDDFVGDHGHHHDADHDDFDLGAF